MELSWNSRRQKARVLLANKRPIAIGDTLKSAPICNSMPTLPHAEIESMVKENSLTKFDETTLSKGHQRKLTALRKSLGTEIADTAFAQWLESNPPQAAAAEDRNAALIAETLMALVNEKNLQFPRGGYIVRRGRGRILVEPRGNAAAQEDNGPE